jgi:endonuclease/exonuclease/phosphatase family metal-dependent hydrolase
MPTIFDEPPPPIKDELDGLQTALDQIIPAKLEGQNLLIGTWNIRTFGSLTREWTAGSQDSPKRDLRALRAICEIVSRLDVVAIQEVVGNLRALRDMMKCLGKNWSFLMTDVTLGKGGHNERMAFVFDRTRLMPSGLACELVVPPEWLDEFPEDALRRQFARTPYAVSFRAGSTTFILVTLHVMYGKGPADRVAELKGIARWMADWARRTNRWHHNLLALGDFNIDRKNDELWKAFTSTGLTVPQDLEQSPRTVFADPNKPTLDKYYDQIAWFQTASGIRRLSMDYMEGGHFDFLPHVYKEPSLSKRSISYRISDHYPLWAAFSLS